MADRVGLNDALSNALSTTGAGGTRVTRAEYDQIRSAMPMGSSFSGVRSLAAWAASDEEKALYASVATSSSYADFCQSHQQNKISGGGSRKMGNWENL